ncbi:uncharacterized protein LOC135109825 isoform X2 [Scylla paramamosain]|uniref:uncharacterized protein LOC135109825 isoform X2 n=1 Tax=Scylla paramamosain TaxID=85552 RepID=UPI00308284C4
MEESHTDYYGSLECLPLAPLRKKPPPYASRRQQEARRGSYLKGILSSSTGDLTQAGNKTRVVNKSPGKDARGRTKDRGDSGLPPVCGEERGASGDVSSASGDATHVLSQHRCQGSVLYGSEGRKCSDDTDYHISKPVREEYTRKYSNGGTEQHLKSTENSRDWHAIENKATEKHRHLDHKMQRERERAEEQNIEKKGRERQRDTGLRTERGRSRLDREGTGNKATERHRNQRGKEATENRDREKYRDLNSRERETPEQDNKTTDTHTNTNPKFTRERAKSEGNLSDSESLEREGTQMNTNSLKNYRQLAAIPDHTFVKWSRSKSLDDVTLNDGVDGDEGRCHVSSSGKVEYRKVDVCEYSDDGMKVRPALSVGKEGGVDRRGHAWSVGKMDVDARNGGNGRSYASLSSVGKGMGVDGKNYPSSSIVAKKVDVNGRNCALSVDKVDVDGRSGPSLVEKVDYRKVSVYAEEKPHSTTSSPTSLSSPLSSVTYSPKDNEEGAKVAAITDEEAGVFVATPIFLEGGSSSSSASPSPSPSPPPLLLQGSDVSRNKLDSTDTKGREEEEEGKAALSTLRREILHLTRLKEEIEQNLLRSQSVLKKEVTGLRQEHGALAATVEERERQLHSQQAEIQDLKGTIKQLQALVFTSDTETRLQRQASDLQELLREEKRHHLEETTQLRREVKLLSSQLREKDHQLEKYRSSPSLASWSGDGVMGRPTKEWKTSLPDVRGGKEVLALGAPVAERRKSFSGVSDSSGDGPASWAGSLEHSTARSSDDVFEASYIAPVRSYTSAESCRISERPQVAPGRSNISVKSSRISEQPPTDASMSKHTPVGSDMIVRSSRKSERSPTGPSRSHLLSLRDTMPGDTQSGDEQGRGLVKTTLYVELHDYSKSGAVKEVPRGSHRSGSDDSPSSETPGHIKTRGHTEEGQRGKYLSRGGLEEDQREKYRSDDNRPFSKIPASVKTRGGSEMRPSDRTRADVHNKFPTKTQPVVTKPSQPSTVSLRPSRPSASPPSPPQVTREAGGNLTSPARQEPPISRVSGAQDSRPKQKALEDTSEGLGSSWQDPRGSRGVVSVRTSWMYKPVTGEATGRGGGGGGGRGGASGGKRDVDVFRGEKKGVDACREERAGAQSGVSVGEAGRGTPGTSYISATLQCLFTVPLLREFFRGEFWQLRVQSEVVQAVADTFLAMESGTGEGRAVGRLHEAVGRRDKVFRLHQDPPAADLLSSLLAWLHHDLELQAHPQMSSVVSRLFHGLRESLIVCPRQGILSSALESFNFVTLSVPGEGAWSLQELLGQRFRPQDMAWECQPCRGRHPCSHKIHMLRPPQVLVLFLRSPPDVATRVLFPDAGLSLALHHQDTAAARSPEYQLVGVVNRQGGEGSSLYSAYCRRLEDGHWGLWREGQVAAVSRKEVLSKKGAHLLFYLQCQQDKGQSATHRATRGQVMGTRRAVGLSTCV